jgi:hypothetical protein
MMRRLAGTVRIIPGVIATCRHWRRASGFHRCRVEIWGKQRARRRLIFASSQPIACIGTTARRRSRRSMGEHVTPRLVQTHHAGCKASLPVRAFVRRASGRPGRGRARCSPPNPIGRWAPIRRAGAVYACLSLCAACPSARNVAREEPAHPTRIIAIDTPSHPRCDLHRRWRTVSPKLLWLTRHRD